MKLTIAEIRTAYRNATDKEAAIKELAASEEVTEQMIKFYVRGNTGPVRPTETPAQYITEAFAPVPKKRRGRPAKKHEADKKAIKATKTVIKVPEIVNDAPDPVVEEIKCGKVIPISHHYEAEGEPPYVKYTCPNGCKWQVHPWHKTCHCCNAVLDWSEVNGPSIVEEPVPATQAEREMFFADVTDDTPAELPKVPIQQTRIQDEKCDVCKNYGDFCTTCRQHDGFEPKFRYPIFSDGLIKPSPVMPTIEIPTEELEAQPKPVTHILKCQQPYFNDIWEGYKPFEIRHNDREYEAGDSVLLIAYNAEHSIFETRQIFADIGYILSGKSFPALLDEEVVVFSLINIKRYELQEVRE